MGRVDLIVTVLRPFQPPDRQIPENPDLEAEASTDGASADGDRANAYFVIQGQRHMIQETVNRHRYNLRSLGPVPASDIMFRGYRAGNSILVHYTIPRKITAVLKLMAYHSDPRLVFMGVTSLQIDAEAPIKVAQGALFNGVKRQQTVDDIEVGCSTRTKQQRAPRNWTRLSALNLFSDALPLHLQVAASLEYQGFSYSLVQALVQKDQLREQEMKKKDQLREQKMKKLIKKKEVDSNTIMTLRSKLTISENRLKEALEANAILEKKLQQAREYAEKAAKQVTSHVTEYRGEKPPGGWSQEYRGEKPPGGWSQAEKADVATQTHLAGSEGSASEEGDSGEKSRQESIVIIKDTEKSKERDEKEDKSSTQRTEQKRPTSAGAEGAAPRTTGDSRQGKITYGGKGSEPGKFWYPRGVVVSSGNEVFVADEFHRRVQVHTTERVYLRHFPTVVPGTEDKDMKPHDVSMDGNGTLWVVGEGESAEHVVQYSMDGTAMTQFHLPTNEYYRGIAVDMRNNHILVTDADCGEVEVFRPDGSLVRRFGHPEGEMRNPLYITVDGEGNILVSDPGTDFVYMYDESGKFLLKFGGEGSGEGQLRDPHGICTDSSGNVIVADWRNKRVQMFTRHGEYVRTIETEFNPEGVAAGPAGQLVSVMLEWLYWVPTTSNLSRVPVTSHKNTTGGRKTNTSSPRSAVSKSNRRSLKADRSLQTSFSTTTGEPDHLLWITQRLYLIQLKVTFLTEDRLKQIEVFKRASVRLQVRHVIPRGIAERLDQAVDVFDKLMQLDKIDQENLDFIEEILERMGRVDLIVTVLRPFQPPNRQIPENPDLEVATSTDGASADGERANAYFVIQGQDRMTQETVNRHRYNLRSLGPIEASDIMFRGYRAGNSILVHYTIPRKITAVLRLMAYHSDPRLVFMGVTSLQIDAEAPIVVAQGALFNDIKRRRTVDDIEVGCSTRTKQQRAPRNWTRLSALNLFSDALPLHLQVAASLEYQGLSYSLVQALLTISENRLKEALEANAVLEKKLQQASEYAEKAAKQVTSHVTEYSGEKPPGGWSQEYRGEKPPGGWSAHIEKADVATQTQLAGDEGTARKEEDSGETAREKLTAKDTDKNTERDENVDKLAEQERPTSAGADGAAPRTTGDFRQGKITYGGEGSEPGKFQYPHGVVVSSSNEIFVADTENRRVQIHTKEGVYLRHFPTVVPGTEDKDMRPYDVSMDGNGTLWVVGNGASADHVVQYSTDGTAMTQFHLQKSVYIRGIAVDMRNNHILVTAADRGEVEVFRPDGSLVRRFGHPQGEMRDPRYITVDGEGNILVSDWYYDFVYMYDESGKFLLKFRGEGSGEGQLRSPYGICTDSSGHIIVADSDNKRVQMFTRHGEHIRSVETGFGVQGVAVGPEGQLVSHDVTQPELTEDSRTKTVVCLRSSGGINWVPPATKRTSSGLFLR
ncbi:hypothetical protein Bbelb_247900 [Branchiostoma belcheri]|nr:hypothetical protein Bbelb_247900 [Branchiostoma belcheri]